MVDGRVAEDGNDTVHRRRVWVFVPAFEVPDVLFSKIADEDREDWERRFSGTRS